MYAAPSRRRAETHPDARESREGGVAVDDRVKVAPPIPPDSEHDSGGPTDGRRRRPWLKLIVNVAAVVALLMTGAILLQDDGPADAGVTAGTRLTRTSKLVVTKDGTVIEGRDVRGPIYIKADNVTIRDSRVQYGGDFLIRIYPGFKGALIEDVDIVCPKTTKGSAVAFGRYIARRVDVTRCKNAFLTTGGNVQVSDSLWNGKDVEISLGSQWSAQPLPTTTLPPVAPPPSESPTTTARPAPTTTVAASAPPPPAPSSGDTPDESNTGVASSVQLTPSGSMTITEPGKVVQNLRITGTVTVEADNVTIRNTLIENTGTYPIRATNGNKNLVVEDVEINGNGQGNVAVYGGNYTLRRVDIHGTLDGPRIEGDNVLIEDSYIHHLHRVDGGHHDTIQIRQGSHVKIRGNNLQAYNPDTNDPMNAAIQIGSMNGPSEDVIVENNLMNGGNYTIGAGGASATYTFRNNVFGPNFRYGILNGGDVATFVGNVMQTTGAPVS